MTPALRNPIAGLTLPILPLVWLLVADQRDQRRRAWWASLHPVERSLRTLGARVCAWASAHLAQMHDRCVSPEVT